MWREKALKGGVQDQLGVDPYLTAYMPLVKSLGMGINFVDSWAKYWGKGPNSSFGALKNLFSKWEEIN